MTLFRGTYRVETARLPDYDYASTGWYHVVVYTHGRACRFGEVVEGEMVLSPARSIAYDAWPETLVRYPRAVRDVFVVMPNHVHVIVGLLSRDSDATPPVETRRGASLRTGTSRPARKINAFGPLRPHSLSSIVNHYKGRVTKRIRRRQIVPDFAWQPRFYDRVIRNDRELAATRDYVVANPANWAQDDLYR